MACRNPLSTSKSCENVPTMQTFVFYMSGNMESNKIVYLLCWFWRFFYRVSTSFPSFIDYTIWFKCLFNCERHESLFRKSCCCTLYKLLFSSIMLKTFFVIFIFVHMNTKKILVERVPMKNVLFFRLMRFNTEASVFCVVDETSDLLCEKVIYRPVNSLWYSCLTQAKWKSLGK